ncbi:hypothetical protein ASPBRDRAFT_44796 [Aspergillus brasiliensis CBS 101740]|uniref:ADP/ATP translocase n=1 Tax=Aspergillus brasiliensis (strain CBS 101740 / IMI 381727 / IBT 21946) TaxID=767769 RepID=A0A1L9UFZ9_ASPBC|nr:hypothetical protein ASPBRDRAFT_44796 [Aspergillus brasiliensis CBS 101740]
MIDPCTTIDQFISPEQHEMVDITWKLILTADTVGGVSAAVSKTAAAPIERIKLLIQNQVG